MLTTDGPFVEGKEHVGGFWVIKAPDRAAADARKQLEEADLAGSGAESGEVR